MIASTREKFEDIWFNPTLPVVEKNVYFLNEFEKCLYVNGKLVGSMVVTAKGTQFFVEETI